MTPEVVPVDEKWAEPHRLAFRHVCDRGDRGVYTVNIPLHPDHKVSDDGETVTPSILCPDCGLHGYWTNGKWQAV